jgi:hypothetical protein
MHCINVMTGALAKGTDTGATILIGGKRTLKIGDLMGTVVVPFLPLKNDEDYDALVELGQKVIDFFAENALEHERTGEMIERIGLVNFLEGVGIEIDPNTGRDAAHQPLRSYRRLGRRSRPHRRQEIRLRRAENMATMRTPIESGGPDNRQFLHPALLKNYGNWRYHDRPGAAPRRARRRRGVERARRHAAADGRTPSASCATSPTATPKAMCASPSAATSSSWSATRPRSSR